MATGWGMAIGTHNASYAATVAKVQVDKKTGKVDVQELWAAQDSGMTVNPGLIENQMSGNLIQGTSVALQEALRYDKHRVTSTDWVSYPILRFKDAPKVHTYVVQRTRSAVDRLGRAAARPRRPGDRERDLRRDGRAHVAAADDSLLHPRAVGRGVGMQDAERSDARQLVPPRHSGRARKRARPAAS